VTRIWFRNADHRFPFLWGVRSQPAARWHAFGDGPAQYLADTPDGAWAEFLRHEEIKDPADLAGVERDLWAVAVPDQRYARPRLARSRLLGGLSSYPVCQAEARRIRATGTRALLAPSAALIAGGARGQRVRGALVEGGDRDGRVLVLFGTRRSLRGWLCARQGRPAVRLLALVRPLAP
jgi:hypothetical protein